MTMAMLAYILFVVCIGMGYWVYILNGRVKALENAMRHKLMAELDGAPRPF